MKQKLLEMVQATFPKTIILMKSKNLSRYGPTTLILTYFTNSVIKMHVSWPCALVFQISSKYKFWYSNSI